MYIDRNYALKYIIWKNPFSTQWKNTQIDLYIKIFLEAWVKWINRLEFGGVSHKRTTWQNIHLVDNYAMVNTRVVNYK